MKVSPKCLKVELDNKRVHKENEKGDKFILHKTWRRKKQSQLRKTSKTCFGFFCWMSNKTLLFCRCNFWSKPTSFLKIHNTSKSLTEKQFRCSQWNLLKFVVRQKKNILDERKVEIQTFFRFLQKLKWTNSLVLFV